MPWPEMDVMEQRIKFVARAVQPGINFTHLCADFGIDRTTGYRWVDRYREVGHFDQLAEQSRRPHTSPERTAAVVEARVVALRRQYGWGADKLQRLLRNEGLDVKRSTLNRIIARNHLLQPEDRHRPATRRFERQSPNELWQMDFKGEFPLHVGACYPLSILDDHSRFLVGLFALVHPQGVAVTACLVQTFEHWGVPEAMLMDHGSPWWSTTNGHGLTRVSVQLVQQGIRLHFSGIGHPQTQGKVERFHRTLKAYVRRHGSPQDLQAYPPLLTAFSEEYNQVRPHAALGLDVPASHYQRSPRSYNPQPPAWEYPDGYLVRRLNAQGCLNYNRRRYFVCEALATESVGVEEVEQTLLISYRHMYIREIDTQTGRSRPVVRPTKPR